MKVIRFMKKLSLLLQNVYTKGLENIICRYSTIFPLDCLNHSCRFTTWSDPLAAQSLQAQFPSPFHPPPKKKKSNVKIKFFCLLEQIALCLTASQHKNLPLATVHPAKGSKRVAFHPSYFVSMQISDFYLYFFYFIYF